MPNRRPRSGASPLRGFLQPSLQLLRWGSDFELDFLSVGASYDDFWFCFFCNFFYFFFVTLSVKVICRFLPYLRVDAFPLVKLEILQVSFVYPFNWQQRVNSFVKQLIRQNLRWLQRAHKLPKLILLRAHLSFPHS
jgi:hypothetical protein